MKNNRVIKNNVIANYLGTGVMVLAPIVALPYYASFLGAKQFGLIGFVATLQAFLGLLDSGFAQVLIREFSLKRIESDEVRYKAAVILFGFERIYWIFSVGAGFVLILFAEAISSNWLVLGADATNLGQAAVYGAAALFIAQFPGALYRSVLTATQEQTILNGIVVGGVLIKHGGGLTLLMFWPSIHTYLIWQVCITILETIVRANFAWKVLQVNRRQLNWDFKVLHPILSSASKMSWAVLMGALTVQMDKIILSRMVPIEQFGLYIIASTISQGVLSLITPLVQAFSPSIMQLRNDHPKLIILNIKLTKLIFVAVLGGSLSYILMGEWVLNFWLKDLKMVSVVQELLSVLLLGSVLNAFYHVGYFNWLAARNIKRIYLVNGMSLIFCILFMPLLIKMWGMIGATFTFVIMNLLGLVISLEWVLKNKN
jgi:O-antigen/teichoic acid export membrane protein